MCGPGPVPARRPARAPACCRGGCTAATSGGWPIPPAVPADWKTASNEAVKLEPRSRIRNRKSPNFTVASPASDLKTARKFPARHERRVRAAIQSISAGLELAGDLRGVTALVPLVHLPVLLAGPVPSGGTSTSRRCQGCLPPSPAFPGSGCPQLHYAAATAQRRSPSTSARLDDASWRSRSPSQCPASLRPAAAAGLWLIIVIPASAPARRVPARRRGLRLRRPVRSRPGRSRRSPPSSGR
jgi:hypothetical protein